MRAPLLVPALAAVAAVAGELRGFAMPVLVCALVTLLLSYRDNAASSAGLTARAECAAARDRARTAAVFALAGLLIASWRGHPEMLTEESHAGRFAGTVVGDVRIEDDRAAFALALDTGIVVRAHVRDDRILAGERVVGRGRLVPFDEARNPGEPSRRALALAEGLAGELIGDRIVARAAPDPRDARTWAARLRASLSIRLRTAVREPEATVVAGALWGERGTLPAGLRDDFQATGTVHVLVTAGLHLGVIAALVLGALRLARVPRIAASLSAIPCVIAYAWLSGAHLPSQRAAAMVSVALLARACGARAISWNALAFAALVVAAIWPASVTTVSFALSFSCVSAIVLFAKLVARGLERCALPERVREALALTVSTQIGVWPLSAATFGLIAPYAVIANAIVVPATGIAMLAGIAALALAHIPILGRAAATMTTYDVDLILRAVHGVATLPGSHVRIAPPPAVAIVAYDVVAVAAAWLASSGATTPAASPRPR